MFQQFFLIDEEDQLIEIKEQYQNGIIMLPAIIELQKANTEASQSDPVEKMSEEKIPTRKSDREKKKKKPFDGSETNTTTQSAAHDRSLAKDPLDVDITSQKGKGKKITKAEKSAAYQSVLDVIAASKEQVSSSFVIVQCTPADNLKQGNSTTAVQVQLQSKDKSDPTLDAPNTTTESVGAACGNKKKKNLVEQTPMGKKAKVDLLNPIIATASTSKEKVSSSFVIVKCT